MTGAQVHFGVPLSFGGVTTAQRTRPGPGFTMGLQVEASVRGAGKTLVAALQRTDPWPCVRVDGKVTFEQGVACKPFGAALGRTDPGPGAAMDAHMHTCVRLPFESAAAAFKKTGPGPVFTMGSQMLPPAGDRRKAPGAAFDKADPGIFDGMSAKVALSVGGGPELPGAVRKRTGPAAVGVQVLASVAGCAKALPAAFHRAGIRCVFVIGQKLSGAGVLFLCCLAGGGPGLEPYAGFFVHFAVVFQAGSAAENSHATCDLADISFSPAGGRRSLCRRPGVLRGMGCPAGPGHGLRPFPSFLAFLAFLGPEAEHGQHLLLPGNATLDSRLPVGSGMTANQCATGRLCQAAEAVWPGV